MLGGDGRANTKKEVNAISKLGSICPLERPILQRGRRSAIAPTV